MTNADCECGFLVWILPIHTTSIVRCIYSVMNGIERRRQVFFGGGMPRAPKGYHAPPAGRPGGEDPRSVAKFHFFKRCKVLENESSFQKSQYFSCPKNLFFNKIFEKLNIFSWNLWIFSKNNVKIFKFYEIYKSREIFGEFPYLVEKFTVAAKGIISVGTLGPLQD